MIETTDAPAAALAETQPDIPVFVAVVVTVGEEQPKTFRSRGAAGPGVDPYLVVESLTAALRLAVGDYTYDLRHGKVPDPTVLLDLDDPDDGGLR